LSALPSRTADVAFTVNEPGTAAVFELRELWASRELLLLLVWRDVRVRYKQTAIGVVWAVLQPLLAMLVISAFFGRPARLYSEGIVYPLFAYSGFLVWTFFANAVFSSSHSLLASAPLITKVYFPRVLVPIAAVGARLLDFAIALALLAALMTYYGVAVTWRAIALAPLILLTMALGLAIGTWLAALNVKYRDVNVALPHVMQLLLFATPVFYSAAMLPPRLHRFAQLNPLAILIEGYRAALFNQPLHWNALAAETVVTLVLLVYAGAVFRRMEEHFADVL
jgi:lipopolysaccharide transport system permease protein